MKSGNVKTVFFSTFIILFVLCLNSYGQNKIIIGTQTWMTENLDVNVFRNGDTIPEAKTDEEWSKAGSEGKPAWCFYNNDTKNGENYGRIYNWFAVNDSRGLAPQGWHIPGDNEWSVLTDNLGGDNSAGKKMKATYGWIADGNGNNKSGFAGTAGGGRYNYGAFYFMGEGGLWWSTNEYNIALAWFFNLSYNSDGILKYYTDKRNGYYVRCLKD